MATEGKGQRPAPGDGHEEEVSCCYEGYRENRRALQQEIQNAKARSWMELVESVESNPPWGRPYQLVTKKLRPLALH
jgi:hypothetical protein